MLATDGDLLKTTLWPGWFTDSQLAGEQAQHLSAALGGSVNAGKLSRDWLAVHGQPAAPPPKKRKKKRRTVPVPGARPVTITQQPPPQQAQPQPPPGLPVIPGGFLTAAGVAAAIFAALSSILTALWTAAWLMGWSSAVAMLGTGAIEADAAELDALLADGAGRIDGMLATRIARLERALAEALRDGMSGDELAEMILAILDSPTSALLVTQSEVTWAASRAAYAVYVAAGVKWVRWQTRNDSRVCPRCMLNQVASPVRLGQKFPSGDLRPLAHPRCRCALLPAAPPKGSQDATAPPPAPSPSP